MTELINHLSTKCFDFPNKSDKIISGPYSMQNMILAVLEAAASHVESALVCFTHNNCVKLVKLLQKDTSRPLVAGILTKICQYDGIRLRIIQILRAAPIGDNWIEEPEFYDLVISLFKHHDAHFLIQQLNTDRFSQEMLLAVSETPVGLEYLVEIDQLQPVLLYLQNKVSLNLSDDFDDQLDYIYMLTKTASFDLGASTLHYMHNEIVQDINKMLKVQKLHYSKQATKLAAIVANILLLSSSVRHFTQLPAGSDVNHRLSLFALLQELLMEKNDKDSLIGFRSRRFALEIILSTATNLDSWMMLDQLLGLSSFLVGRINEKSNDMREFRDNMEGPIKTIIDYEYLLIKRILRRTSAIGGQHEIHLPSLTLNKHLTQSEAIVPDTAGSVNGTTSNDTYTSLKQLREALIQLLKDGITTRQKISPILTTWAKLNKVMDLPSIDISDISSVCFDEFDEACCRLSYQYLQSSGGLMTEESFIGTLKQMRSALKTDLNGCYDWFTVVTLILFDDHDLATHFLTAYARYYASIFSWRARNYAIQSNNRSTTYFTQCCHFVEKVVKEELPIAHNVFRFAGFPLTTLTRLFLDQCFLNYLNIANIFGWLALVTLFGPDITVYFIVAILKHRLSDIVQAQIDNNFTTFIQDELLAKFEIGPHLDYIFFLQEKYQDDICLQLKEILTRHSV